MAHYQKLASEGKQKKVPTFRLDTLGLLIKEGTSARGEAKRRKTNYKS